MGQIHLYIPVDVYQASIQFTDQPIIGYQQKESTTTVPGARNGWSGASQEHGHIVAERKRTLEATRAIVAFYQTLVCRMTNVSSSKP